MKTTKENWLKLAKSDEEVNRKLALTLIPSIAEKIQPELMIWYSKATSHIQKQLIFSYLLEENQSFIQENHNLDSITKLETNELYLLYEAESDVAIKKALLHEATTYSSLIEHLKNYAKTGDSKSLNYSSVTFLNAYINTNKSIPKNINALEFGESCIKELVKKHRTILH